MKALLVVNYNGEQLSYETVTYDPKTGFKDANGNTVWAWHILDISRDTRSKYVKCSSCGELIKNTPEAIEAHKTKQSSQKDCLSCSKAKEGYGKELIKKTYVPDPNNPGMLISTVKSRVELRCDISWKSIYHEDSERMCKYMQCTHATYQPFSDWFTEYPHAFEVLPTVDMLLEKKWKLDHVVDGGIVYHHPRMTTLEALVNTKGVVTEFRVTGLRNGSVARMRYSKKYDLCFFAGTALRGYTLSHPYSLPDNKYESALPKIKELF